MSEIRLTLTSDEAELIIDALEADLEDYLDGMKEARAEKNTDEAAIFSEAADRIRALLSTLRQLLPEDSTSEHSE